MIAPGIQTNIPYHQLISYKIGFELRLLARRITRWQRRNAALRGVQTRRRA